MKKRILTLFLSFTMIFCMLPGVSMAAESENESNGVAEYEVDGEKTIYASVEEMIKENGLMFEGGTLKLLDDIEIPISMDEYIYMALDATLKEVVLDLNGYTLTFSQEIEAQRQQYFGIDIIYGEPVTIQNGTIIMNVPEGGTSAAITGLSGIINLNNLEILATDGKSLTAGVLVSSQGMACSLNANNCIIDVGNGYALSTSEWKETDGKIKIESGSYKNLLIEEDKISVSENSVEVDGVSEGTTVYTSDSTTAIIVQNGRAYLYDTLQEAVDAAKKRGTGGEATITLVKQPDEKSVTLPEDANIILKTIGKDIDTSKIPMTGPNDEKVEVGTDGKLEIKPSEPEPEPPTPPIVITYYDITATQPEHGTITLEHDRIYRYGDVDVTLTAEEGYEVKDLLINGVSVGAVSSYTIKGVTEDIHVTAVFGETEAAKNDRIAKGVQNTTIRMYYKKDEIGKGWIKLRFKKSFGFKVDNYEIFRSAKKKTSFGEKPWFVTKTNKTSGYYKNGKSVKKGTRYFYKMRGVREIAGETYYTQWSNIVMRTGR